MIENINNIKLSQQNLDNLQTKLNIFEAKNQAKREKIAVYFIFKDLFILEILFKG